MVWACRPMFLAIGLFLGLKSKILHEQNVIYFQFYIRLPNFRLLGSIIKSKSLSRSNPLSILYRLFFETQGRKHGRNLSWSCSGACPGICQGDYFFTFAKKSILVCL